MHEHVTVLRPGDPSQGSRGLSTALPPDLLAQVRGRLALLAGLLSVTFALEPLLFLAEWANAALVGVPARADLFAKVGFRAIDGAATLATVALWWVARSRLASASLVHLLGLIYEVVICFEISISSYWQHYLDKGDLPTLIWVPSVVVLFPLLLPGPPRRMLVAAVAAAATSPLSLALLSGLGKIKADGDAYMDTILNGAVGVAFAYTGARVIYRLGREVAVARELGSYRLEELLGQGGMGEVWRARHRMLARPAAIKLIRPAITNDSRPGVSDDAMKRFEREAQVIASLRSPHTVDLFDFGVAVDGAFYYVMELLDGLDVDKLVRRFGPMPAERVVFIVGQICHSLSEAESFGLVHRDIKPANVFLCRYGEDHDFVKVLDFGLVKAFDDSAEALPGAAQTRETVVHGTPAFIAPEQAMGRADLDHRVDIYATGCVAYWMLTGQLVFAGETSMELLMQHAKATPLAPSSRTELPIPAALDRLVLECLAKDPADRPQTARELSRRLAEIAGGSAWTEERARRWWATHQPSAASRPPAQSRSTVGVNPSK